MCVAAITDHAVAAPLDTTSSRPIRIGIVGAMVGDIGQLLQATVDGVNVAITEANLAGGIAGRNVELVIGDTNDDDKTVGPIVDALMANASTELDVMAFMPGRMHIDAALPVLERHDLTLVAPVTGDRQDHASFNKHLLLVTPIPDAEIEALLRFLVLERKLKRIAVVITNGFPLGMDLLPYISRVLAGFGLNITFVFRIEWDSSAAAYGQLAQAHTEGLRIQALINIASLYMPTGEFLLMFLTFFPDAYVGSAGLVVAVVLKALEYMPAVPEDRMFSTMFAPMYSDTSLEVVRQLRSALPQAQHLLNYPPPVYEASSILGVFLTSGYVYTSMLLDTMRLIGANGVNKVSIHEALFSKRIMKAHEWILGPYSADPCARGKRNSPLCECNSGSRTASMVRIVTPLLMEPMPESTVEFSLDTCIQSNLIQSPLIQLVSSPNTSGPLSISADRAVGDFVRGDRAGYINVSTSPSSRTGILLMRNYTSADDLALMERDHLITVAVGGVYRDELAGMAPNISMVLDPLYITPRLSGGYTPRVVYLTATLEQEIHTLASIYGSQGIYILTTTATGMLADLLNVFRLSLHTFGHTTLGGGSAETVAAGLSQMGGACVFDHGIVDEGDVEAMGAYLSRYPSATLLVPFHHFSLWYREVAMHIRSTDRSRLVFATSLPNWNVATVSQSSETELMQSFYRAVDTGAVPSTPRGLQGFLIQRLLANIVERIPSKLTQATFMTTLFAVSVVVLEAGFFTVGPLSDVSCDASTILNCETNVGARRVEVRSLRSSVDAFSNYSAATRREDDAIGAFVFSSGRVEYTPLPKGDGVNVLAVVVGVVVGGFVFIMVLMGLLFWLCTGRSHRRAPKDQSKPFTIVFTDIQSSTSLWAEVPEEMGAALEIHHRIIRQLIKKHRGYEVKTIGDAFMVAFKSADDAVLMSYELQHAFFECAEFSPAIDSAYLSFDRERLLDGEAQGVPADDIRFVNLTANLPTEAYAMLWSGLRVRVGIHTAFGDIKRDEVTDAYDYYGTVTNTAARVESVCHGGQVCLTDGTLKALSTLTIETFEGDAPSPSPEGPSRALRLGPVELRGLADHVLMYQLECVTGRAFPPLRLEEAVDVFDDDESSPRDAEMAETESMSKSVVLPSLGHGSKERAAAMLPDDLHTAHVMLAVSALFSAVPSNRRAREMKRFLDIWRIRIDRRAIDKAQHWGTFKSAELPSVSAGPVPASSGTFGASMQGLANATLSSEEILKGLAFSLSKDDAFFAASLEGLSRRLRPIGLKHLKSVPLPRADAMRSDAIVSFNAAPGGVAARTPAGAGAGLLEFSGVKMGISANIMTPNCPQLSFNPSPGTVEAQE